MKPPILVTLTRDMRPNRAGDSLLLPPDVAERLMAEGAAGNPRDRFGNPIVHVDPNGPAAIAAMTADRGRRRYLTK